MKKLIKAGAIGFAGGTLVASLLLSFIALIGKLGDTGSKHVGYWEPAVVGLGLFYGGPCGAVMMLLLRLAFSRLVFKRFVAATVYAGIAALLIGMVAGRAGPGNAAPFCIVAFLVIAVSIIVTMQRNDDRTTARESGT